MKTILDGPKSSLFHPIHFKGNADLGRLAGDTQAAAGLGLSAEMAAALKDAPGGSCVCWGIPFEVGEAIILADRPVPVEIDPLRARWLVFMHTSDVRPLVPGPGGFFSPMRGRGQLGEQAAEYVICYADGSEARATIRRRFQLGAFQRGWGENCFESVPQHKPFPMRASQEQPVPYWGVSQMRVHSADEDFWVSWLWAWENPSPEKPITGFRFEPGEGTVILSAITAGDVSSLPLRWQTRRKACLRLPEGETFQPNLDENGLLKQLQIDLGQVISAVPRLVYPNEAWETTFNNQLPGLSVAEILVEYTAHPEACFHLGEGSGGRTIPVSQAEQGSVDGQIQPVAPAEQIVAIRTVERASRKPVPVKLHIHGEWGEYLAPVDRHRILDIGFFEDYSVDFAHIPSWEERIRSHICTYINGATRVKLPVGKVFIEISKGFEIRPVRKVVDITAETREIEIEIEKALPWREKGWVSADTHVHFLSPISAMLEGAGEGVNVINLLASPWGELMTNVGDFDGRNTWGSREAGGGPEGNGEYLVRVGSENRQHVMGHISLLGYQGSLIAPMTTGGPNESALGDPIEALLTEWARQCHRQGGLVVLPHFPNPRAEGAAAIVNGEVDAVEMTSWEEFYLGINPYSLSDWYRYLNCGFLVPAVGGTDKMTTATAVGTVRTYARLNPEDGFQYESWKEAVRRGETFVTYGPLIDFLVDGQPMGGRLAMPSTGGTVDVVWQAASVTFPMSRVELVVNGEIRESQAVAPEQASGHWRVRVERSCWMALLVRGHYPGMPEVIAAHSTPVMIQVEGTPLLASGDAVTILEQIEGAIAYLDSVGTRAEDRVYKRMRLDLESAHRRLHNQMHAEGIYHE